MSRKSPSRIRQGGFAAPWRSSKVRQEKQADIEAKNQARKEHYERQLREEQEKDQTEVDESNPFYGYFLRHCKKGKDTGTPEADNVSSSGT